MRRLLVVFMLLVVACSSLFAVAFGYGWSMEGYSGFNQSSSSRFSLMFDFTDSRYLVLEAGAGIGFRGWSMVFTGLDVDLSLRTFGLVDHIFSFMFANPTIWSPKVSAGAMWDADMDFAWRFGFSMLNFIDVHFNYEFLRPFVLFDGTFDYAGWGMDLIRVSYYF